MDPSGGLNGEKSREVSTREDELEHLQIFMKKKLDEVPGEPLKARPLTISPLPARLHENSKLSEPRVVSIGPYHHGKESLQGMEVQKWFFLRDFLARNNVGLEVCLREMRAFEAQARQQYGETKNLGTDDFTTMLLLDGCFIVEWFLMIQRGDTDGIFNLDWVNNVYSDLFLMQNQIPFFVTKKLLLIQDRESHNCQGYCPMLELFFLRKIFGISNLWPPKISCSNIHHLLHLYYEATVYDVPPSKEKKNLVSDDKRCKISCVSELQKASVKFKTKNLPHDMLDISFENGIMKIPFLKIDDLTRVILSNMVAFEKSQGKDSAQILSSYLTLMDALINSEKDVAILEQCSIFKHSLQSNEDAAAFFDRFDNYVVLDQKKQHFHALIQEINAYTGSTWHKYRARLMHSHFCNPWIWIAVLAAGILVIHALQTYYSAK